MFKTKKFKFNHIFMFKNYVENLVKNYLKFDLNKEPPTIQEIEERVFEITEILNQEKKIRLTKDLLELVFIALSFSSLVSLGLSLIFIFSFKTIFFTIIFGFVAYIFKKEIVRTERIISILKELKVEKEDLSIVPEHLYESLLDACKHSQENLSYHKKIIAQGRKFLMKEYELLKASYSKIKFNKIESELYPEKEKVMEINSSKNYIL